MELQRRWVVVDFKAMAPKIAALAALLGSVAACQLAGPTVPDEPVVFAPTIDVESDQGVDGLIVGHRLMAVGEFDLAIKAYLRAAGTQGMTPDVLSALGSANLRLGRLGQAEKLLRQAIDEDPEFVPAWNNLGVTLMEQGNNPEAMEVFRRAFALDSGESDSIRENLRVAIAKTENPYYDAENNSNHEFALVRQGSSQYMILPTP